jgi:hypothetical protein
MLTLVLFEKKIMNETKNHNPSPLQVKWSVPYVSPSNEIFFLHQDQNIFFSNIGNRNIFLEKNHNPQNGRSLVILQKWWKDKGFTYNKYFFWDLWASYWEMGR